MGICTRSSYLCWHNINRYDMYSTSMTTSSSTSLIWKYMKNICEAHSFKNEGKKATQVDMKFNWGEEIKMFRSHDVKLIWELNEIGWRYDEKLFWFLLIFKNFLWHFIHFWCGYIWILYLGKLRLYFIEYDYCLVCLCSLIFNSLMSQCLRFLKYC